MQNTRLIMVEGLPGTGKSTISYFLSMQLEYKVNTIKWIHEVSWPHPVLFFNEASLAYKEYEMFLLAYPQAKPILNKVAIFDRNSVRIDLYELEWNYIDVIGIQAFNDLKKYDVWNYSLDKYINLALDKWAYFTEKAKNQKDNVYIMDACIFQYQIFWFLLQKAPYKKLERFIHQLTEILKPLNPSLIYLYRDNAQDTIDFLEKIRGRRFLENIWERDRNSPYYIDKPKGAEGHKIFLKDYSDIAKQLFRAVGCLKKFINITNQDWEICKNEILSFLKVERRSFPNVMPPNGIFTNKLLNQKIEVHGLTIKDPRGTVRTLTPKSDCEFYVECLPVILRFVGQNKIVITGGQISARWTISGTMFESD